jgi:hypothetical protein
MPKGQRPRELVKVALLCAIAWAGSFAEGAEGAWKAGTGRVAITPKEPIWMAGYAARTRPSDGAMHDLWAKALALEDPTGRRVLLITLDVCGIDRALSNRARSAIKTRLGFDRDRVVLACSHTHSGPVVGTNLLPMYKIDAREHARIAHYAEFLIEAIVEAAEGAARQMTECQLAWGTGRCDFAVNRRANLEGKFSELKGRLALDGPVDHDVPVLKVSSREGSVRAVVFGYACHCTVLDGYQFSGDYAGFAQLALEKAHPGLQAMFFAGCGADQNPIPRRSLELAKGYGTLLAEAVEQALRGPLQPLEGPITTVDAEIPLAFATLPTKEQIEGDSQSDNFFVASRARHLLKTIEAQGRLEPTYPYPITVWRVGKLNWVFLGGEVVVDYALRIKRNLGTSHTWVAAYCNDVMAYIPSLRVLKEGGYEGGGAMLYYGLPTVWSEQVEESIMAALAQCLRTAKPPARATSGKP